MAIFDDIFRMLKWPHKSTLKPIEIEFTETHGSLYWSESQWPRALKYFRDQLSGKPEGAGWRRVVHLWSEGSARYIGISKEKIGG